MAERRVICLTFTPVEVRQASMAGLKLDECYQEKWASAGFDRTRPLRSEVRPDTGNLIISQELKHG